MTVFVQDSFTDSDGTALQSHTGELGAAWSKIPGFSRDAQIQSNGLENLSSTDAGYSASGAPASADYDVALDYSWINSQLATFEVLGRIDTASGDFYSFYYRRDANQYRLRKRVSGSYTTLASGSGGSPATGVFLTHRLALAGTGLEGLVDGVSVLTATDASLTAAGKAGLAFTSPGSTAPRLRVDNFLASQGGGAVSVGPHHSGHDHAAATAVLTQHHELAVHDAGHGHAAALAVLAPAAGIVIVIADGGHGHNCPAVVLGQHHMLGLMDAAHGHHGTVALLLAAGMLPPPPRRLRPAPPPNILSADARTADAASARRRLQPER